MSDSVWPYGWQPARLLCPWGSPGKTPGAGCCALLPGAFRTEVSNWHLLMSPATAGGFFTTSATWEALRRECYVRMLHLYSRFCIESTSFEDSPSMWVLNMSEGPRDTWILESQGKKWRQISQWGLQRMNLSELGMKLYWQADSTLHINLVVMVIGGKVRGGKVRGPCRCGKRGFYDLHSHVPTVHFWIRGKRLPATPGSQGEPLHGIKESPQITPSLSPPLLILLWGS